MVRILKRDYKVFLTIFYRRNLTFSCFNGSFSFRNSWKQTYVDTYLRELKIISGLFICHKPLVISNCFSYYLYKSWLEAVVLPISDEWLHKDNVPRREKLSRTEFVEEFAKKNRPVILTDIVSQWPAFQNWKCENLERKYGNTKFRVSASIEQVSCCRIWPLS